MGIFNLLDYIRLVLALGHAGFLAREGEMVEESQAEPPSCWPKLLRRTEIREIFGVSDKTITRWTQKGLLPVIELRGVHRFHPDDVSRLFRDRFHRRKNPTNKAAKP